MIDRADQAEPTSNSTVPASTERLEADADIVIEAAAEAMSEVTSVRFDVTRSGAPVYIDPVESLALDRGLVVARGARRLGDPYGAPRASMTQTDNPISPGASLDEPSGTSRSPGRAERDSAPGLPPRIELDACLQPGRADSRRLLVAWFVKKSFWWSFFGGTALASVVHFIERVENEFQVNYRSPESVEHGLLSAWVFVVLAVLLRVAVAWIALAMAFPLARAHEIGLAPRTGWNRHYATLSDRYKVAKAYRALRWTHHVRQVALDRVSPGPGWWRRMDPILDVVNVIGVAAFITTAMILTTVSVTDLLP